MGHRLAVGCWVGKVVATVVLSCSVKAEAAVTMVGHAKRRGEVEDSEGKK